MSVVVTPDYLRRAAEVLERYQKVEMTLKRVLEYSRPDESIKKPPYRNVKGNLSITNEMYDIGLTPMAGGYRTVNLQGALELSADSIIKALDAELYSLRKQLIDLDVKLEG